MIEWLRRVPSHRVFLSSGEDRWTYGDALTEVERRLTDNPRVIQVSLDPGSIFDVMAGISGGGATVVGPENESATPHDSDLVVFTSGTTGAPKGVRLTRGNLSAAAVASAEHLGHGADDDWLLAMPLHHVGGLSIVVRQVFTGGKITVLAGFEPDSFADAMKGAVTMVSVVPTMLQRIIPSGPFTGLRAVLVGGGPIPDGLLEESREVGLPVLPTYGMTETFGQVATLRPGETVARKAHPLPGIEVRIEDDGRIALAGEQVSPGYVGEADRADRWFVTNDLGEIEDDGALRVLGRADNVIVTGGENVSPERVESALRGHRGVDEVVITGVEDAEWGQVVVGLYEGSATPDELKDWAGDRLPGYMVPKRFHSVEMIPRTAIGKPDRKAAKLSALSLGGGG